MSFHEILIGIMAVFALLGGIDRILGSRFGLGPRFEEGILAMGTLGLAMIGIVCLAPVLARLLRPIVVPVYGFLGADPAMFAGTLLACDMGGASLARELALSPEAAGLGGILTGSMLGATVVFTIPVAMGLLRQEDRPAMAKGILCGIVAIPLGILAAFVLKLSVQWVYFLICLDEFVKMPFVFHRYRSKKWLANITRDNLEA